MEKITKRNCDYYYGDVRCYNVDDAYSRFRADYNRRAGRKAFCRLERIGNRKERIHGAGLVFETPVPVGVLPRSGKVCCRMLGLLHLSYCRIIGLWDYSFVPDEDFDQWIDWVFSRGSGVLRTVGKKGSIGRTSKRLKTKFR